jgi:hypothetical protein
LNPPRVTELNMLRWHAYLVLYPIAALVWFFPVNVVLLSLYVLSSTGVVVLTYIILRARKVSIAGACLFCLLIVSHPAWSEGLLEGQFYPDRLFVLAGFIFMYLVSREATPRIWQVAAAVLCMLINERTALTAGLFLLAYVILYWKRTKVDRSFKLIVASALLLYGALIVKFAISGYYYSSFLPTSLGEVITLFEGQRFAEMSAMFVLINAPLLVVALFAPRAAAIAALLMLPNIFGTIGGAEKIGWSTHYPSEYLPALIWAALLGYLAVYRKATGPRQRLLLYLSSGMIALFLSAIDPYSFSKLNITTSNILSHFLIKLPREASVWFGSSRTKLQDATDEVRRAIPEGSIVSTIEAGMPILYHSRTLWFFPLDVDHADFAVVTAQRENGEMAYSGATTYLGAQEQRKVNEVMRERMRKVGYDLEHPLFYSPVVGLAVLRRSH